MRRATAWATLVAIVVAAAWAVAPAQAGSQQDPEVVDERGDQDSTAGPLAAQPQSFDDIDIVAAWVAEDFIDFVGEPGPMFAILVQTAADIQDDATFTVVFAIEAGPTSLFNSTASGEQYTITWAEGAAEGIEDAEGALDGNTLRFEIPAPSVGAVGGDVLTNLSITSSRADAGTVMPPVTQDDESGSDDAGPGRAYTFTRPDAVNAVEIRVVGGIVSSENGMQTSFSGTTATITHPDQELEVTFEVSNTGTDRTEFIVRGDRHAPLGETGGEADSESGQEEVFRLDPGASQQHGFHVDLVGPRDDFTFRLVATGLEGAEDVADLSVVFDLPAALVEERDVYPAGLDFLTPAAEATGLDGQLGDHAELFLLAVLVLLAFIAIFLLLFVRRPLPVAVAHAAPPIEPAKAFASHVTGDPAQPAAAASARPAVATAGALGEQPDGIELGVLHARPEPDVGDKVTTTAVVRNKRKELRRLRVALVVDGRRKVEEEIELMPRGTREVPLPWVAGPGKNVASVEVTEL